MKIYIKVYIAVQEPKDPDDSYEIIYVGSNREDVDFNVLDYFGINPNVNYAESAEYLGFIDNDCEYLDGFLGTYSFKETDGQLEKVSLYYRNINE